MLQMMLYLDLVDLDYIVAVMGSNDQMNGEKKEVLKSDRKKELKRCQCIINDKYIE